MEDKSVAFLRHTTREKGAIADMRTPDDVLSSERRVRVRGSRLAFPSLPRAIAFPESSSFAL